MDNGSFGLKIKKEFKMLEILKSSVHESYIDIDDINYISLEVNDNNIYFHFESQHNLVSALRCLDYEEAENIIYKLADRTNLLVIEEYDVITLLNLTNVVNVGLTGDMQISCRMKDQELLCTTELEYGDAEIVFAKLEEKLLELEKI